MVSKSFENEFYNFKKFHPMFFFMKYGYGMISDGYYRRKVVWMRFKYPNLELFTSAVEMNYRRHRDVVLEL